MNTDEVMKVLDKLIGPIEPVGSEAIDADRVENMKIYCEILERMHTRVNNIVFRCRDCNLESVKKITDIVNNSLNNISVYYD